MKYSNINLAANQVILPVKNDELYCFLCDVHNQFRTCPVKISKKTAIGRAIFALREYSPRLVEQKIPPGYKPILVEFPNTEESTTKKHFVYYSIESVIQINDLLSALFDIYFHLYFNHHEDIDKDAELGEQEKRRNMLLDSFIFGLGIIDFNHADDKLKKRAYRQELYEMNRIRKKFELKDYRFRKMVFEKRKRNIQDIMNQDYMKI